MNEETRQKIKDLLSWMYERHYTTTDNMEDEINFTPTGSNFMSDTFGAKWNKFAWTNFGDGGTLWLPYPGFNGWGYAWYMDWESSKEEFENRLDILIKAIGADIGDTDYIELDDIVL